MYSECPECYGTGYVFFDAHSRDIDLSLMECPVCDGEGVIPDELPDDQDDDDDGETGGRRR